MYILTRSQDSEPTSLISFTLWSTTSVQLSSWWGAHQVAFETNEVDPHGDCAVGVAAEHFNPVHQVSTELVAPFQHAEHHDVMVPKVIHDVSGQTFCPVNHMNGNFI